ncbi:MAG: hypothetical protein IID37_00110 [Planctomycetes bacterium]|nr:hypothetical protein [Planctomycetota bacterium]
MVQFCIFGGHDGELRPEQRVFFTMFGGCELKRPTLGRQLVARHERERSGIPPRRPQVIVTIFGGTEITHPTLAEEFLDLNELTAKGKVSSADCERYFAELDQGDAVDLTTITLFGSFEGASVPSENAEVDALALHRHLGNISDRSGEVLQLGIGLTGAERRAILRQAVGVTG